MVKDNDTEEPVLNAARKLESPAPDTPDVPDMEAIYRSHAQRVLAAAYRVTGSAHDAEDVLQTIFLRLVRRESGVSLAGNPTAYLHRAAINAGLDLVRSRTASRSTPLDEVAPDAATADDVAPDEAFDSGELHDEVRKALTKLSPRSAEIFVLRYFEGYDNHEIASMLGSSRSTVAVILHRARNTVREAIRPYVGETR